MAATPTPTARPTESSHLRRFFQEYDGLQQEASTLTSDRSALEEAQNNYKDVADKLNWATSSVAFNKDFIQEQKNRIELISTHWFYGTTALQPQLWFRGGCQGKIDRAKAKLLKSTQDHPQLEQVEQHLQEKEKVAREFARRTEAVFGRSFEADREVKRMKEELVQQYPTDLLYRLESDKAQLEREQEHQKQQMLLLEQTGNSLICAKRCASNVECKVQSADKKTEKANQLSKEEVFFSLKNGCQSTSSARNTPDNGREVVERCSIGFDSYINYKKYDAQGNLVLTNHPCPSGCGYLITWHGSHCCSACSNPRGNRHGPKCERISLSSQEGAQDLWNLLQKQRQEHQQTIESTREEASEDLECATRELHSGFDLLRSSVRSLTNGSGGNIMFMVPSIGGCSSGKGSMLRVQAHQLESAVREQETVLWQRQQSLNEECQRLYQLHSNICLQISEEKDAILDSVRASLDDGFRRPPATAPVFTAASSSPYPVPHTHDNLPLATARAIPSNASKDPGVLMASLVVED